MEPLNTYRYGKINKVYLSLSNLGLKGWIRNVLINSESIPIKQEFPFPWQSRTKREI